MGSEDREQHREEGRAVRADARTDGGSAAAGEGAAAGDLAAATRSDVDPVCRRAAREALVAFAGWVVATVVTISVSFGLGHDIDAASVPTVLGMPVWVFWGIIVPWIAAIGFGVWFSLAFVRDDDLGSEPDDPEGGDRRDG